MSKVAVEQVIGKLATDSEFRKLWKEDPSAALKDLELTDDERDSLMKMDSESLEKFSGGLDDRISKIVMGSVWGAK